ncbi:DUF340 domain-containing protein [Acidaminobacterium chupaoyuni]
MKNWAIRIKVLIISGLIGAIGNCIATWKAGNPVAPWAALPALGAMFLIILVGCAVQELLERYCHIKLPKILYISMLTILLSIPGFSPVAGWIAREFSKVGTLALCTPILAYAGISIGKDMESFKKQGLAIICVALMTFVGTYLGSAIIAQILLKATGVI